MAFCTELVVLLIFEMTTLLSKCTQVNDLCISEIQRASIQAAKQPNCQAKNVGHKDKVMG